VPKAIKLYTGKYKRAWADNWVSFHDLSLKDLGDRLNLKWEVVRNKIKAYSPHLKITFNGRPATPQKAEISAMLLEIYEVK